MLKIKDILKLRDGLELILKREITSEEFKGLYEPDSKRIIIFYSNIKNKKDMDLTLLHEFVHARDHICYSNIRYISDIGNYEKSTEKEAIKTYIKKPHILRLIKDIYNIKYNL